MRKTTYIAMTLAAIGGATAASAQTDGMAADPMASEPATAPAPAAASAQSFTDAQITQFAEATIAANEIQSDATIADDQKQAALIAAVEATGIDAPTYNAIVEGLQADPALEARVSAEIDRLVATPAAAAE